MSPLEMFVGATFILGIATTTFVALAERRQIARARALEESLQGSFTRLHDALQRSTLEHFARARQDLALEHRGSREEAAQRLEAIRGQLAQDAQQTRTDTTSSLQSFTGILRGDFATLTRHVEAVVTRLAGDLDRRMATLTQRNDERLDDIRRTVSEKLEGTLERRLGDSFKLVSDRLEQVHKGLGEMQSLAVGVGDLKKIMSNVKTRGTWGEVALGALLDQLLVPEQFGRNVQTKASSNGRVEFAIRMPNREAHPQGYVWLPIDAKFPLENYHRLVDAQERADPEAAEAQGRLLETFIREAAREIADKYLDPPGTTDFGVMYLPTEGLFAEVARRTGLVEGIQRDFRVVIAGPTTLAALLNSLQMGFRSLAIQRRSSEVWELLGAVKTEFGRFDEVMRKVEKKLQEAGNVITNVHTRSRVIHRRLRDVEQIPQSDAERLLALSDPALLDPALADDDLGRGVDPS